MVDYLYPDRSERIETAGVPAVLSVPMKVGIAFVPAQSSENRSQGDLSEKEKIALLREISDDFKKYPFVKSIEIIPSAYLTPQGSFANLDQMRTMFGTDVIALVSYDQVQFTDEGLLSLSYWTLVGAYVVKGEKNDTQTMMDSAVYHIPSRKMLFRAPGLSHVKATATLINLEEQLRKNRSAGFTDASKDLVVNLQDQLEQFKEKIKTEPEEFKIQRKPGSTGGGSIDGLTLLILAGAGGYLMWARRRGWQS
jgi:rhombotail lipoprotein